jgi:protein CpxP
MRVHASLPWLHVADTPEGDASITPSTKPGVITMKTPFQTRTDRPATTRAWRLYAASMLVALGGTVAMAAHAHEGGREHRGKAMGGEHRMMKMDKEHGQMHGGMHGRHMGRMLDSVNATPEQRAQIRQIREAAATDLKTQREATRALREQNRQLFTQPTVDANAAEALRQQMLTLHDQTTRRSLQAQLDVSRVLTPEQRAQWAQRTEQRREMGQRHQRERAELEGRGDRGPGR